MKNRRDILILAGLFAVLVAVVVVGAERASQTDNSGIPTTHSSSEEGAQALYDWTRAIGYDAQRLEYRPFELEAEDQALIIINPTERITAAQVRTTLDWVEAGGTLILADDTPALFGPANQLLDELNIDIAVYSDTVPIEHANPQQPALNAPPTGETTVRTHRMLAPQRNDYVTLLGAPDVPLLAGITHGDGYIFVSATSYPFTTAGLRDPENAALLLNLLRRVPSGGRVLFDEIHHGYEVPPSAGGALTNPWGIAAFYALTAIALYLILTGRRFGRPVPLREEVVLRSSAEYVESMADLFQRGGKRGYVLDHYRTNFKRRLARPYGINPQLDDERFVRELGHARGHDDTALATLLAQMRTEPADESTLVRIVAAAEAYTQRHP